MTDDEINEHFLSLENHRNAIKVLVARIESEVAIMGDGDKAKAKLDECAVAFKATYAALDDGVTKLDAANTARKK